MLPAWQGAGRLSSSLQKETKTKLTPASPAKVSKQMHCELWDLHSLSCLCLFACPAPFLHGNGPLKKKKSLSATICTQILVLQSVSRRSQTNTFKPRCLLLGFSLCAVQSYPVLQSTNPHQTIFFSSDVSYLSSSWMLWARHSGFDTFKACLKWATVKISGCLDPRAIAS